MAPNRKAPSDTGAELHKLQNAGDLGVFLALDPHLDVLEFTATFGVCLLKAALPFLSPDAHKEACYLHSQSGAPGRVRRALQA